MGTILYIETLRDTLKLVLYGVKDIRRESLHKASLMFLDMVIERSDFANQFNY
jgi:hypothetical protein